MLPAALEEIAAHEHKELLEAFVRENSIDLKELSSFEIRDVKEYQKQENLYPFARFDDAFFDLPPIQELLPGYVRMHLEEF